MLVGAAELPNLDPLDYTQDPPQPMVWPSVMEYLVKRDWKTMQIAGLLAEKWEQVKPDTWRYVLRKGIKFQNGEPFNADSVVYSLGVVANKDTGSKHTRYWPAGGKITKVDDFTVEVTSPSADPIQPLKMVFIPMVPPKWAKENPELRPIQVYGTGPYKFVEWVRGQYIRITANDDYWGPAPTIKDATFIWRGEAAVRAAMLKTGEADWAYALTADDAKSVPKYAASTVAETAGVRLDTANPVLKDQRVRLAMNLAVDRQSIVDKLFAGFGEPAKGQMIGEYVLGFNPDIKPYTYDVPQAKKLVQDAKTAGIPTDTTELEMWVSNGRLPHWNELAESLSNSFNSVGLKTKLRLLEHSAWVSGFASVKPGERPGPLFQWPHGNDLGDSSQTIDGYVRTGGSRSTHSDPALDAIIDKATVAVGDERVKLYQQAWKKVYDDSLLVPLYRIKGITGLSKRLNFTPRMDDWAPVQDMSLAE